MSVNVLGTGRFYKITDRGLLIDGSPCYSDWAALGTYVSGLYKTMPWVVGDWLIWGEDRFPDVYSQAMNDTGLEYSTLRNYKWVCRSFAINERFVEASFTHHLEVASLPKSKREELLKRAIAEKISARDLRYIVTGGTISGTIGEPTIPAMMASPPSQNWLKIAVEAWDKMSLEEREIFLTEIGR